MTVALELWTDGSGTREAPGGWAYLLRAVTPDGEIVKEVEGCGGEFVTTSQRMEVMAVVKGLDALRHTPGEHLAITLYTDSEYVRNSITGIQLEVWETAAWHTAGGSAVKHADLWREVLAFKRAGIKVRAVHVKGHSGNEANDYVDQLAGEQRRTHIDALGEQLAFDGQEAPTAVTSSGPTSALTGG